MSRRMNGQPECPKCGKSGVSKVKNTYFTDKQEILRHRKCECGWGFWSYQELEMVLEMVLEKEDRALSNTRSKCPSGRLKAVLKRR